MYVNKEEQQIIDIFKELLDKYDKQGTREVRDGHTRVSVFGRQCRFNLNESFPLLTHRQHFLRAAFEEVMWYLRGETDNQILKDKNVHVWDLWEGQVNPNVPTQLGKIYGHMFRNFGATDLDHITRPYTTEYLELKGFDQIEWLLNEIKVNPNSSRLIISNWDPVVSTNTPKEAVLPCCLTLLQFNIDDGKLNAQLYQRSSDCTVAGGWNIAQIALMTHMIAQQSDLAVGDFVWTTGDIHFYGDQIEDVRIMAERETHPFPKIKLKKAKDIYSYEWSDIEIIGYQHSGKIENLKVSL